MKKRIVSSCSCLIFLISIFFASSSLASPHRIFFLFSYHQGLFWHENAERGVKKALRGIPCVFRSYYMDTKRHPGASWILSVSKNAIRQIYDFHPDILVGFDDNACHYVLTHFLGTKLSMVFLGMNREPEEYGFVKNNRKRPGGNVTGVLERHYFVQSVQLFSGILKKPSLRIGIVSDSSETSHTMVTSFMKIAKKKRIPITFFKFAYSFPGWQEIIRDAQNKVDLLIIYNAEGLKGKGNIDLSSDEIISWTVARNKIPEVSFFSRYIKMGLAGGIVLTGYYQGLYAGKKVAKILRGTPPGQIPIDTPPEGTLAFNVNRLRELGLKIPLGVLQSAVLYGKQN